MANIQTAIKSEIAKVAQRAIRAEVGPLRKTLAEQRSTIAALRREVAALQKQMKTGSRNAAVAEKVEPANAPTEIARRFSAERLAAHRQKLGLSAAEYAKLVGVSSLSIYKWESGKVRPRAAQIEALGAVKGMTREQAQERLAA